MENKRLRKKMRKYKIIIAHKTDIINQQNKEIVKLQQENVCEVCPALIKHMNYLTDTTDIISSDEF